MRQPACRPLALATCCVALCGPVAADDMWAPSGLDLSLLLFSPTAAAVVVTAYALVTILVEGWILTRWLSLGRAKAIGHSALMNLASGAMGAAWWVLGGRIGWTEALQDEAALAVLYFTRSYLVTLSIEGAVLLALLRQRPDTKRVLSAVVVANAASYTLLPVILAVATLLWPTFGRM